MLFCGTPGIGRAHHGCRSCGCAGRGCGCDCETSRRPPTKSRHHSVASAPADREMARRERSERSALRDDEPGGRKRMCRRSQYSRVPPPAIPDGPRTAYRFTPAGPYRYRLPGRGPSRLRGSLVSHTRRVRRRAVRSATVHTAAAIRHCPGNGPADATRDFKRREDDEQQEGHGDVHDESAF